MLRIVLGWFLIIHAVAHAGVGTWSSAHGSMWPSTILWTTAFAAYTVAGLGVLRVPKLRSRWKPCMIVATIASIATIAWYPSPLGLVGAVVDIALLIAVLVVMQLRIDVDIAVVNFLGSGAFRHPRWVRAGWVLGWTWLAYASVIAAFRPVSLQWGTTDAERTAALPGDEVHPLGASYRIDHAITIQAPAAAVWPWLVQLGEDRGGFYSYDWLERSFGDDIRNADRIHPEWQRRQLGDTILATQRAYLGGRFGTLGWRVNALEPGRVIGLEKWGTFVLQPIDTATTRLIVRTRGAGEAGAAAFFFAPLDVFVFEPAHFIMERGMMRGIRDRAERGRGGPLSGAAGE
jgi:hypothetical protein